MKKETNNSNSSKATIKILIAIMIIAGVAWSIHTYTKQEKVKPEQPTSLRTSVDVDSTKTKAVSTPDDTLTARKNVPIDWDGEDSPWVEYRVIGHSPDLTAKNLKFGDKVWVDDLLSKEPHKVVFEGKSTGGDRSGTFNLNSDLLIEAYRFDKYRTNFSLEPFATLSSGVKKTLLDDNYSEGHTYSLTQNEERAKSTVAIGDFDQDGVEDVAVIMDNNEKQISRLLIFCTNKAIQQPYIAFAENFSDKMRLRSFRRHAKIYMNTTEFVPAPRDGIILSAEDIVLAIVYDEKAQKFKTYLQE